MTVDANIIIAYLAGDDLVVRALSEWRSSGQSIFLPTVAETEILSFSSWTDEERLSTEKFLEENFVSIPFDRSIARLAAELRRFYKIKLPDATIAATALFTFSPLITRNDHDFKNIKNLQIIKI